MNIIVKGNSNSVSRESMEKSAYENMRGDITGFRITEIGAIYEKVAINGETPQNAESDTRKLFMYIFPSKFFRDKSI